MNNGPNLNDVALTCFAALAVVMSLLAFISTRRQAKRAHDLGERMAKVEEDRRSDELRPIIAVVASPHEQHEKVRLTITNNGPVDLTTVAYEVPNAEGDIQAVNAVEHDPQAGGDAGEIGPMSIGESATLTGWRRVADAAGASRLVFVCSDGLRTWRVPAPYEVPPPPPRSPEAMWL